ncbi:hypothetical protein CROQUDRAFT_656717 [Cronartium quercuum f. sp. fusiforme G11]|uniref:MRH domain-containing protein n=1 Tax=Cronartium quercuum f. sp. fusiforme G11 TaxID=708437 RepID=A0A9P6NJU8_9BASI|nr:hypothetical protein CROQUDRAFT_656717 [Cronartium quercuum f. sp. fusiforme G11]
MVRLSCGVWLSIGYSLGRVLSALGQPWTIDRSDDLDSRLTRNAKVNPHDLLRPSTDTCTMIHPVTKGIVDLNRLTRVTGTDYTVVDEESGDEFKINVCKAVLTETWGIEKADRVGIYKVREREKGESLGSWNSTLRPHGTSASIQYRDGSPCKTHPDQNMGSIISFECAHDVWHTGNPVFAGSIDGCQYFFTWRTSLACASSVQRSLWHSMSMVLVVGFVIFLVYFVLFFFYRRFHLNLRGREQFPTGALSSLATILSTIVHKLSAGLYAVFHSRGRLGTVDGHGENWNPSSARAWWEQNHRSSAYAGSGNQRKVHSLSTDPEQSGPADIRVQFQRSMNTFSTDQEELEEMFGLVHDDDEWDEVYSPNHVSHHRSHETLPAQDIPLITRTDVNNETQPIH